LGGLVGAAEAAACCWQAANLQQLDGSEPLLTGLPSHVHARCQPLPTPCSVTLLDCFTIPMVLLLSAALLAAAYRRGHYAGAGICVAGLALLVATDRGSGGDGGDNGGSGGGSGYSGSSNPLLGDGLVLLGATLYAVCNVLQEWLLGE
jgi:hypothetical protein